MRTLRSIVHLALPLVAVLLLTLGAAPGVASAAPVREQFGATLAGEE